MILEKIKLYITSFVILMAFSTYGALSALAGTQAGGASPKDEMQRTIDNIITIAEAYPGDAARDVRRGKLRALINPKFNFAEMAKRSLGPNWSEISDSERQEFTEVFSELLARTYLSKIETVKTGMVKVESENVEAARAVVKTTVVSKGDTFPIDYKMTLNQHGWQVYDVVIENIGLVANYRNEFAGIIRKDKFSGLMERLRKKIES
jgi:phospholipid transport system substrate-binding protein